MSFAEIALILRLAVTFGTVGYLAYILRSWRRHYEQYESDQARAMRALEQLGEPDYPRDDPEWRRYE